MNVEAAIAEAHIAAADCESCGEFHPDEFLAELVRLGYSVYPEVVVSAARDVVEAWDHLGTRGYPQAEMPAAVNRLRHEIGTTR